MLLTDREREILSTIIESFITTAQPVASRAVARHSNLQLSSASMRAVMADLTDKGLLEQPHTSAGRIPTPEAFRVYVDSILDLSPMSVDAKARIREQISRPGQNVPELLRRAGRLLSDEAHQVSVVLAPSAADLLVRHMEFVSVKSGLVLAILVLSGGLVQQRLVAVDPATGADELTSYVNYLNELIENRTLAQVREQIVRQMKTAQDHLSILCQRALAVARQVLEPGEPTEMFVDGKAHMLRQPEFGQDPRAVLDLFEVLDEQTKLLDILDNVMHAGQVTITLGRETPLAAFAGGQDVSLVASPYMVHGQTMGLVSVLGPMRMDYARVVPMVEFMAQAVAAMLEERF